MKIKIVAFQGLYLPAVAMVIGTSFHTAKGKLVRSILYDKPNKFEFERSLYYFIYNLVAFLGVACAITFYF